MVTPSGMIILFKLLHHTKARSPMLVIPSGIIIVFRLEQLENAPVPMARVGTMDLFGRSGTPAKLFEIYGLDTKSIVEKAKEVLAKK